MGDAATPLAEGVLRGEVRAAARLMRSIEDGLASAEAELRAIFPRTGRAYLVGVTGNPGSGKSTLVDGLIAHYRKQGLQVGVVAVDPSSPFSGGAILGDRIRMQQHAGDAGVFIRSLATRGHLGGLARAATDVVRVLDAMGKDVVLVETVGVGQDEVEIAKLAHTTVVVVVPGLGDDIQALKAGVLEIADVFALNKSDREGADRTQKDLLMMLELRGEAPAWQPPIVRTVAVRGEGGAELAEAIAQHRAHLEATGEKARRETARAKAEFLALLRERLVRGALERLERQDPAGARLDAIAERIARREADPYALADEAARG
jgi:LAO/AO transport system kinase